VRTLLNIVIALQVLLGLWWTVPLLFSDGDFSTLAVLFVSAAANAVFLLIAAWAMWKHPALRRRAGIVIGLPFGFYLLPSIIKAAAGGPLTDEQVLVALLLLAGVAIAACLVFPKRVSGFIPRGLVQSRALNWLFIVAMAGAWLFPLAIIALLATDDSGGSSSSTAVAYVIIYLAMYIVAVGGGALLMMTWGWIGLRSSPDNPSRGLHIAQVVMGSPSLLLGIATLGWLASQQ
jgi:hypothetical protein